MDNNRIELVNLVNLDEPANDSDFEPLLDTRVEHAQYILGKTG